MNNKAFFIVLASFLVIGFGTAALSNVISNESEVIVNVDPAVTLDNHACSYFNDSITCSMSIINNRDKTLSVRVENIISSPNGSVTCDEFLGNWFIESWLIAGSWDMMQTENIEFMCSQAGDKVIFYRTESYEANKRYGYFGSFNLDYNPPMKTYEIRTRIKAKEITPIRVDPMVHPHMPITE